jgi:GAF domain-containing protein
MSESSILLITRDNILIDLWQQYLPDAKIYQSSPSQLPPLSPILTIIDCFTLSPADCQYILACYENNTNYIALLDETRLSAYGTVLLKASALMLHPPLDEKAITQVRNCASLNKNQGSDEAEPDEVDIITYTRLARKFAQKASNSAEILQMIADAVRDSMHADLVIMLRMEADKDTHYSIETLASSRSQIELEKQQSKDILRPDGHTEHIVRTGLPVIIRDISSFELDGMPVHPQTLAWGFQSAVGLPLMRGEKAFGAIWVLYRQHRLLTIRELGHLQIHTSHAALAYNYPLQKKLADQWQRAAQNIFTRLDAHDSFQMTLQKITDGIHESLDCDVVTLYVYHPEKVSFELPYQKGAWYPDALRETDSVLTDSIVYAMLQETEPQVIENVTENPLFGTSNFAKREAIHSTVALPLHRGQESVGVVFINFRKDRAFNVDERQAIATLGAQIATSILNARLDKERQQTVETVNNLLKETTEQGNYIRSMMRFIDIERDLMREDSSAILQSIAQDTCKAAGANRVTIRLVDGDQENALAKYSPDDEKVIANEIDADDVIRSEGHSQYIMRSNKRVVIPNISQYDPGEYDGIELNPNVIQRWQARVGLPLTSDRRSIGVMWISYKEPRTFSHSQLEAFQSFANMAFFTQTYDMMQERLHRALEILHHAHQIIAVDWGVDKILYHSMNLARQLVADSQDSPHYHSYVARIEAGKRLVFYQKHNLPAIYEALKTIFAPDATIELSPDAPGIVVQAALSLQTQVVHDGSQDPKFLPLAVGEVQGSQIAVPIFVGSELFAILSVEHAEPNIFEWYDHATLEALASHVGQVIHNSQQQQILASLFDAQKVYNESLLELANAAMHQAVKSHDLGNFRGTYKNNMPSILNYADDLKANQDAILSKVDPNNYETLKLVISDLIVRAERIHSSYQERIEQSSKSPELGVRKQLAIRDWLVSNYRSYSNIHLELDDALEKELVCEMPAYWLREVTKILIENANRAIKAENLDSLQYPIHIQASYQGSADSGEVQIAFSNDGNTMPEEIKAIIIKQAIPRSLREIYRGGRGIGLFMCGIILEAYDGKIEYLPDNDCTTFVLTLPAYRDSEFTKN